MNSRERLLTALNHQEPDRIPLDLGSTQVTGIHEVAYRNCAPIWVCRPLSRRCVTRCKGWPYPMAT